MAELGHRGRGPRAPLIGVLALQGDFAEHAAILRRIGAEPREVRLPEQLDGLDGLVIPGGESTTVGKLLVAYGLQQPLCRRAAAGFPVYGTCAGMILLAREASGGQSPLVGVMDITVRRNAFGSQIDSFEADLPIPALGEPPFRAVFIRAPLIERVGPGVEVLARLADGRIVAARQGHLLVSAFHPELTDDTRFHELFLRLVAEQAVLPEPDRAHARAG